MTDQQPSFAELRLEAQERGIITLNNATQSKDQLAQAVTAARLKEALLNRGGGR